MVYPDIIQELSTFANLPKAQVLSGFFKTWPGEYGEGDIFLGITVPVSRKIVKKYLDRSTLVDIERLLSSPFHEIRLSWILLLVEKFRKADTEEQETIFHFYLNHTRQINNWDLVDASAPNIVGAYLFDKERGILQKLTLSENLWERRIAIIATLHFIKKGEFMTTLSLVETLLSDPHDLIHKANGWMLREIGKHCGEGVLEDFLGRLYLKIPRTTLRYAIERLTTERRKYWMKYGRDNFAK